MAQSTRTEHPLDGSDPEECYKVMMSERTELIKARREAEDNLIKTIIQISAALIALLAGFAAQTNAKIDEDLFKYVIISVCFLSVSLIGALSEQIFASKAYSEQQVAVEQYYQKLVSNFQDPPSNKHVRRLQKLSFSCFVIALISLGLFAALQARTKLYVRQKESSASAAAAAAAKADRTRRESAKGNAVSSTKHASTTSQEGRLINKENGHWIVSVPISDAFSAN